MLVSWVSLFCCYTYSNAQQIVPIAIPGSPLTLNVVANPQPLQNLPGIQGAVNVTMGDDDNRNIPLGFNFPFFNQVFNNSWMYSNGAISFQGGNAPNGFCCSGRPLNTALHPAYNYSILPLWTDLIADSTSSSHYVFGTNNSMTYGWYNVHEYGTNNRSSFEVKIDSGGNIDMRYAGAFVSLSHPVTVGIVGNAAAGEYYQHYNGRGFNTGPLQLSFIGDLCIINPLSSPSCSGYQAAYLQQQCTISPLYDPVCPGYAQAYYTQQCTINPLYDSGCEGYAKTYFDQQCRLNGLYSRDCPNYNTAYATQQTLNQNTVTVQSEGTVTTVATVANPTATLTNPVSIATNAPTTTSTTSPTSVTSVTSVVAPVPAPAVQSNTVSPAPTSTQSTANTETKKADAQTAAVEKKSSDPKREIAAKAKEAAEKSQNATTMEAQVAAQSSVIGLMGYVPGFGSYQAAMLTDVNAATMNRQYSKPPVDNRRALQQLNRASEIRHSQMVEDQYGQ